MAFSADFVKLLLLLSMSSRVLSTFDLHTLTIPWAVDGSIDTLANLQSCLSSRSYEQLWAVIDDDEAVEPRQLAAAWDASESDDW